MSKVEEVEPFGHSGAPKNETMPYFDHFPRLGKINPFGSVSAGRGKGPNYVLIEQLRNLEKSYRLVTVKFRNNFLNITDPYGYPTIVSDKLTHLLDLLTNGIKIWSCCFFLGLWCNINYKEFLIEILS